MTHRLPAPPAVIELLSSSQSEMSFEHGIIHVVTHDPVRLGIQALRRNTRQSQAVHLKG